LSCHSASCSSRVISSPSTGWGSTRGSIRPGLLAGHVGFGKQRAVVLACFTHAQKARHHLLARHVTDNLHHLFNHLHRVLLGPAVIGRLAGRWMEVLPACVKNSYIFHWH
jgi:hypothetical protein